MLQVVQAYDRATITEIETVMTPRLNASCRRRGLSSRTATTG